MNLQLNKSRYYTTLGGVATFTVRGNQMLGELKKLKALIVMEQARQPDPLACEKAARLLNARQTIRFAQAATIKMLVGYLLDSPVSYCPRLNP